MRRLVPFLVLLAWLLALLPTPTAEPEVLGYWLHADGSVTEFVRYPDGKAMIRLERIE